MKKLLLASLVITLSIINHKNMVAIPLNTLEPREYMIVLAKDNNTPVMLSTDIIKESMLLGDLVEQMTDKKELVEYQKNKLQIKYTDLLTIKDLLTTLTTRTVEISNRFSEIKTKLGKNNIEELASLLNSINYLNISWSLFSLTISALEKKIDNIKKHFTPRGNTITGYSQRVRSALGLDHDDGHDDYDN